MMLRRDIRPFAMILVPLLVLSACSDPTGKKTDDELIARVQDTSVGAGTPIFSGRGGWTEGSRCDAAFYLGYRKATAAVEVLIPLLRDGLMDQCVVDALGEIGDSRAVGPLLDAAADSSGRECVLDDASFCVNELGVWNALLQIGAPAVPQLIAVVEAASWGTGAEAREIFKANLALSLLDVMGDRRAGSIFIDLMKRNLGAGAVASGPVGEGTIPTASLARAYADDAEGLVPMLKSKETAESIAYTLVLIGESGTEPALVEALQAFGDAKMAKLFLNSDNTTLEAAARDWILANGYTVTTYIGVGGGGGPSWGSLSDAP